MTEPVGAQTDPCPPLAVHKDAVHKDAVHKDAVHKDAVHEDERWRLVPTVALRPEPFGALAYDFVSRRLSFLKSLLLVEVVRSLAGSRDVGAALTECGVGPDERAPYLQALSRLAAGGLIEPDPTERAS